MDENDLVGLAFDRLDLEDEMVGLRDHLDDDPNARRPERQEQPAGVLLGRRGGQRLARLHHQGDGDFFALGQPILSALFVDEFERAAVGADGEPQIVVFERGGRFRGRCPGGAGGQGHSRRGQPDAAAHEFPSRKLLSHDAPLSSCLAWTVPIAPPSYHRDDSFSSQSMPPTVSRCRCRMERGTLG